LWLKLGVTLHPLCLTAWEKFSWYQVDFWPC
jgi:hypothetical protein